MRAFVVVAQLKHVIYKRCVIASTAAADYKLYAVTCEVPEKTDSPPTKTSSAAFLAFESVFIL